MPMLTNQASKFLGGGRLPVPVLGAEANANPTFAADTNWNKGAGWSIADGVATHTGGSTTMSQNVLVVGTWYQVQWTVATYTSGTPFVRIGTSGNTGKARSAAGTYYDVSRADAIASAGLAGAGDYTIDNVYFRPITLASMFSTRPYSTHVTVKAQATIVAGTRAGVVCNLDSASSPANFVIASHDGTTARLTVCVAGTYTEKIATTVAYSAGAYVEIRRLAGTNTYQLWYAGAQVGADQTIADATVISNTLAGYFQTYAGNTLTGFSCVPS